MSDELTTPPAPEPVAPPVAAPPAAPWSSDLATAFQDDAVRGQVDSFLREKYQPYVTQLEQTRSQAEPALELFNDVRENPGQAMVDIAGEIWGADAAQAVADTLNQQLNAEPTAPEQPQPQVAQLAPEDREVMEYVRNQQRADLYAQELGRVKELAKQGDAPIEVEDDLFHPFVVSSEGDFPRALEAYKNWYGRGKEHFAPAMPTLEQEVPAPPATLGLPSTPATTAPPTMKEYKGWGALDTAMDDWLTEANGAPQTIG